MSKLLNILGTFYNALKTKFATKDQIKQADWSQSDPKQLDYVKNRPFYTQVVEKTIFPKTTINLEYQNLEGMDLSLTYLPLEEFISGNAYAVIIDDQSYERKANTMKGVVFIGNLYLITGDTSYDTGEPFLIAYNSSDSLFALRGQHSICTLEIKGAAQDLKKLDYKYLPDEYQVDIDELWNNFGRYYTTSQCGSRYYTKTEIDAKIPDTYSKTEIDAMIGDVENGSY